ncbi:replication protein A 70 kDa DNA-binding subunit B [Tanacetum coccineum]
MTIIFLKGLLDHIRKSTIVVSKEMQEDQSITPQLLKNDVPNELIHRIQSLLPAKDASRTCVLSKSWLQAWSTIPTLRFTKCVPLRHLAKQEQTDYIQMIDRTLLRYLNENMSIECFQLHLDIHHSSLPYPLENWFQALASTNCSLKELSLTMCYKEINIQVYASGLLYFSYDGHKMPTLFFPSNTPAHIKLILRFHEYDPTDLFYFLKVREALDLSSNFDIETIDDFVPSNIDLDDLRRMVPFPARNVQQLSFGKHWQQKLWKHTPLLDFLLSICYPRYIKAYYRSPSSKNYWYKQMVRIMEKQMCDLKDIEIKNPSDGTWERLTNSGRSSHFLFELPWRSSINVEGNDYNSDEFKLNWLS